MELALIEVDFDDSFVVSPSSTRNSGSANQWARTASVGRRSPIAGAPHSASAARTGSNPWPRSVSSYTEAAAGGGSRRMGGQAALFHVLEA